MTNWIKGNKLKTILTVLSIIVSLSFIIGLAGPVDIIANRVFEKKRPVMIERLNDAVEVHELRMEPRLQAIEHELQDQKELSADRWKENLEIQKEILEEVKK